MEKIKPTEEQRKFMQMAVDLARVNIENGHGGPFGSVIVRNGKVIGKGVNKVTTINDPTAHAEVMAIRDACKNIGSFQLDGCDIYSSCEPCPMCLGAIYWARPDNLYFACTREDAARVGFDDSYIYKQFSLPVEKRKLRTLHFMRDESVKVFEIWNSITDKKQY